MARKLVKAHYPCFCLVGVWHSQAWNDFMHCAGGVAGAPGEDWELVARITEDLQGLPGPEQPLLSVESALDKAAPVFDPERRMPLAW